MKLFNESVEDIFRNHLTSLLFSGVIAVTVFIICVFVSIIYNLESIEKKWSKEVRIIVFSSEKADPAVIMEEIARIKTVNHVVNVSSAEVLELLKKRFPDQDITLSDAMLPSMIEVKTSIKDTDETKREINKIADVEEVTVNTSWFDSLKNLTTAIKYVALIIAGLVFLMSMLLISYVTKLGVLQRKPEISIMRLCGATEWYIRKPYVLSGLFLGFIGGGIGIILYFGLDYMMQEFIGTFIDTWDAGTPLQMLIIYALAMFLGAAGNFIAFSRGQEEE
jgi:cell division transport system permease protein